MPVVADEADAQCAAGEVYAVCGGIHAYALVHEAGLPGVVVGYFPGAVGGG